MSCVHNLKIVVGSFLATTLECNRVMLNPVKKTLSVMKRVKAHLKHLVNEMFH